MLAGRELSCLPITDPYRHFNIGFPEFYTGSLLFLISDTEILISDEAFNQAGLPRSGLSERLLELKGKSEPARVWIMRVKNPTNQAIID